MAAWRSLLLRSAALYLASTTLSVVHAEWEAGAGALRLQYDAKEFLPSGALADEERGVLHGAEANIGYEAKAWRCALRWRRATGSVGYTGATQLGIPVVTTTSLLFGEADVDCAVRERLGDADHIEWHGLAGRRSTRRDIEPTVFSTELGEVLTSYYTGLGGLAEHRFNATFGVFAGLNLDYGIHDRLDVAFFGYANDSSLTPGGRLGGQGIAGLRYSPTRRITFDVAAQIERHVYGASRHGERLYRGDAYIGNVQYPGSTQRLRDVELTLQLNF